MDTKYETKPGIELELNGANRQLEEFDAIERIEWVHERFGGGLYAASSFGCRISASAPHNPKV